MKYLFTSWLVILALSPLPGGCQQVVPLPGPPSNVIKVNLSSLALGNASLQYEHRISKKITLALGFRLMPDGPLPFRSFILNRMSSPSKQDSTTNSMISQTALGGWAITPEIRFYLSRKGFPHGFYLAPFVRYAEFNLSMPFSYTDQNNEVYNFALTGHLNGIGAGVLVGHQWIIARRVSIDFWLIGPFFGSARANLDAAGDLSQMSSQDQQNLQNKFETANIPMTTITARVNNSGMLVQAKGPFAGVRGLGLNFGIAF